MAIIPLIVNGGIGIFKTVGWNFFMAEGGMKKSRTAGIYHKVAPLHV